MFNPSRLSIARMRRQLSKKDLATAISVTPVTITRLEHGLNEPENHTIDEIVKKLKFPREFFYGDDIDPISKEAASFRSLTSMKARQRDATISAGQIAYLLSDWASQNFNLPDTDLLDLSYEPNPSAAARSLRQYWGLGEVPIKNMIKLLESNGVRIFSLSENNKNVDAFSCWRGDMPYVFLNTFKTAEHSRFDSAHELGHLVLHRHGGPHQSRDAEREANEFASSFLMPRADVIARVSFSPSINQLIKAKKRWGVSLAALAFRLHKLNLLSDWNYRTICININKRFRVSEPEPINREESVIWKRIFDEMWKERISKNHIAKSINVPLEEIENLVFGIASTSTSTLNVPIESADSNKPELKIIN